jgi:hypothetical protein
MLTLSNCQAAQDALAGCTIYLPSVDLLVIDCDKESLDRLLNHIELINPNWLEVKRVEIRLNGKRYASMSVSFWARARRNQVQAQDRRQRN